MNKDIFKKLSYVLNKKQRLRIYALTVLILIGGVLEMLGVSMIIPVITVILDAEAMRQNQYVNMIFEILHLQDMKQFIILLLVSVILIFIIKNVFLLFLTYVQSRIVNRYQYLASSYMLEEYLNRPYEFYLNADIPTIFRILDGDIPRVFMLLNSVIRLATELVVSGCLILLLLVIDFKMTLTLMALFLMLSVVIVKVLKPSLNKIGKENQEIQSASGKWRTKAIYGIKDVKVLAKEHYFASFYQKYTKRGTDLTIKYAVYNAIPRSVIETVCIAGLLFYLLLCVLSGQDLKNLLSQMTALGVAAIRLMPGMNRINTYLTDIAYFEPALDFVYENVDFSRYKKEGKYTADEPKNPNPVKITDDIKLNGIHYTYPNVEKKTLEDAEMTIPLGKSVGVVGPSGAGKSTVIDIILGLLQPQEGTITCAGREVMDNYPSWLSNIGYIPQVIYLSDDSIRSNIAFGVAEEEIDDNRIWQVLEEAQMKSFVEKLPEGLDTSIGDRGVRISGGERQRLGIARALYHDPDFLVFDEATSALDNATEKAVMEAINSFQGRKTMVIIAHRLNTIEKCDLIYKVENGKINLLDK